MTDPKKGDSSLSPATNSPVEKVGLSEENAALRQVAGSVVLKKDEDFPPLAVNIDGEAIAQVSSMTPSDPEDVIAGSVTYEGVGNVTTHHSGKTQGGIVPPVVSSGMVADKDDDLLDIVIAVLLSLGMLFGVWWYAIKPVAKHTIKHEERPRSTPWSAAMAPVYQAEATKPREEKATKSEPKIGVIADLVMRRPMPKPIKQIETAPPEQKKVEVAVEKIVDPIPVSPPVVEQPLPPPMVPSPAVPEVKPVPPPEPKVETIVEPPPDVEPEPKVIIRESFEFASGSARLPPSAIPRLLEVAQLLKNDIRILNVVGHTDNIGNPQENQVLSLKRANAVRRFLIRSGVAAEHLQVEGAGSSNPIADNATEEGRQRNRRIDITENPQ